MEPQLQAALCAPMGARATDTARLAFGAEAVDARLQGGLDSAALHEIRCDTARGIGAAAGLLAVLLARRTDDARIVWICDPGAALDAGSLNPDGLAALGLDPVRLLIVMPRDIGEALWAADQALRCPALAAVVLHVSGNPKKLDLTATRRLLLRARESGATAFILRQSGAADATAAATRWHINPAPSLREAGAGIGSAAYVAALERNRTGRTGAWRLAWNFEERTFDHVPGSPVPVSHVPQPQAADHLDPLSPSADRPHRPAAMGQVVAFAPAS